MISAIFSLCRLRNIENIIGKICRRKKEFVGEKILSTTLSPPRKNGISLPKAANGIDVITRILVALYNKELTQYVCRVAQKLIHKSDERLRIARMLASRGIDGSKNEIIYQENALHAQRISPSINTDLPSVVANAVPCFYVGIKKITKLSATPVYNMEVEEAHHFAVNGGFIVHNCIDSIRYALDPVIQRKKGSHFFGKNSR